MPPVPLFRIFLGLTLAWGAQDNVLSHARMLEFRDFVARHGFPYPLFLAYLSAYAQLVCGLLIAAGAATRIAAAMMAVNFVVALGMVHWGLPFSSSIPAMAMLFGSLLLVLHGPGAFSMDEAWRRRSGTPAARPAAEPL